MYYITAAFLQREGTAHNLAHSLRLPSPAPSNLSYPVHYWNYPPYTRQKFAVLSHTISDHPHQPYRLIRFGWSSGKWTSTVHPPDRSRIDHPALRGQP
jgi:hypothetical protein